MKEPLPRAAAMGLAGCDTCGRVSPVSQEKCPRCGSGLHLRKPDSVRRTVAFMLAAIALYIPANILPMMSMVELGVLTDNTIVGGIQYFWETEAYPIAIVILVASILIPLLKILALTCLCLAASGKLHPSPAALGRIYWLTELFGRWSMVDIFVVGILVALVQLGNYMVVSPGPGSLAFAGVVMLTMFAAMSFDPRLLWDRYDGLETVASPLKEKDSLE
jgi:paraquat-inducible protein A